MSSNYLGSPAILTSTTNQEVIPEKPVEWSQGYSLYQFSFINYEPCSVRINDGDPIYLAAEQGFDTKAKYSWNEIQSFVVVESGIRYSWIGVF